MLRSSATCRRFSNVCKDHPDAVDMAEGKDVAADTGAAMSRIAEGSFQQELRHA